MHISRIRLTDNAVIGVRVHLHSAKANVQEKISLIFTAAPKNLPGGVVAFAFALQSMQVSLYLEVVEESLAEVVLRVAG